MFATRNNNENAIYEQQTAAAAKPLNQSVRGLAPKTPANKPPKTPFKIPLNDENANFGGGKTGGKGKDGGLFGEGKGGKTDRNAFVTPAGPRTRAPLGNKTTNAKATAFQTPAPQTQGKLSAKPTSPRMRRAKVKIHQAAADPLEDAEEREIEYMPPRELPLPDYPDDVWPHDRTYPQFEGNNLTKGWWSEFQPKKYASDEESEWSDFEEKVKQAEERERKKERTLAIAAAEVKKGDAARKGTVVRKAPSTLSAKSAASALSSDRKEGRGPPSFAAPTASAKARMPSALVAKKATSTAPAPAVARHTAAKVVSKTTLGYSKGRAVSTTARKPGVPEMPAAMQTREAPFEKVSTAGSALHDLFGAQTLEDDAEDNMGGVGQQYDVLLDDELENFQLQPVEL